MDDVYLAHIEALQIKYLLTGVAEGLLNPVRNYRARALDWLAFLKTH